MLVHFCIFLAEGVPQDWEMLLVWVWIALLRGVLFFPGGTNTVPIKGAGAALSQQ